MSVIQRLAGCAAGLLLVVGLAACEAALEFPDMTRIDGSGTIASETIAAAGFDTVALLAEGDVTITVGRDPSVTITGDDNLLPMLDATVSGSTLRLELSDDNTDIEPTRAIEWEITLPSLRAVELIGAGTMTADTLESSTFEVVLTGAGSIAITNLDTSTVNVTIPGAGSVTVSGSADFQEVRIPGAGDYQGKDLTTRDADVVVAGAGTATVMVTGRLDATVTGVGSILYDGDPEVSEVVSGVGTIRPVG